MADNEAVQVITNVEPPKAPSPTEELEARAELAAAYLARLVGNSALDADLRLALNDIANTIRNLKQTVHHQSADAKQRHEQLVEVVRSQRLHG